MTLSAGIAKAETMDWVRFGPLPGSTASLDQPYDASFAKQWEANPPKGYPTLSPENLNAMKAAIKRYSDVVDRGGWKTMPEVTIQPGANGPNVALLRERF